MAPTFADFIAWPDRREIVLAVATPLLQLAGWSGAGGGLTNTYTIALTRTTQSSLFAGGIYRKVTGVQQNQTALTALASAAAVDAAAGSYFWDEANGTLYVRTTGGGSPDTYTAFAAFVRFYFASAGVVLNQTDGNGYTGIYYQPWLTGDLPTFSDELEDVLFGIKSQALGSVTFSNTHKFWNAIIATNGSYVWKNKTIAFYLGGSYNGLDLPLSQYSAIGTMLVDDVSADEEVCTFALKPRASLLNVSIPITPFFETTYPNMGDGVRGTKKWIGYGRATITPDLSDNSGNGIYTLADAAYQTLYAVNAVYGIAKTTGQRVQLSEGVHYSKDLTACTVTITSATYAWTAYALEVDVTGKPDGAGSYLKTFGAIVKDLLTTFVGVQTSELDTAAFTQADADASDELALWIKSPRQLAEVISGASSDLPSLERSVLGTLYQTLSGLWTCFIWDPRINTSTAIAMRREDFATFAPQPKLETVFSTTRVRYATKYSTGEQTIETYTDNRVLYLSESTDVLEVQTYLVSQASAQTLAQRLQAMSGSVSTEIAFEERGAKLATSRAGDRVLITYDPAPTAGGAYASEPFEIILLSKSPASPKLALSGRLGDLRGIGRTIGRWTDDTVPAYSAASMDQRSIDGFYADDNGNVVAGDYTTKNLYRYW